MRSRLGSESRSLSRTQVLVAALVAGLVAVPVALLYGGGRVVTCWMGIGPAPEPQTSECVARIVQAMTPWERFQQDQPMLGVAVIGFIVFVAVFAGVVGLAIVMKRMFAR